MDRFSGGTSPKTPDDLLSGKRKDRRKPRPHQSKAIEDVLAGLTNAARGQLLMACGTGKTLTSLWIKERMKAKRALVLLPSLNLLSQTLREWTASTAEPFDWLCVCSDASVAKKDDEWVSSTVEIGVPVTNDVEEIEAFLRGSEPQVVFCTYQSSQLIAEAQENVGIAAFDIVFADEAHRCAGKVSDAFGCVLDAKRIRAEKRLFMTATPRVLSQQLKSASEGRGIEVASMDDHDVFGEVLHSLNFSAAIEDHLLTDYRVVIVGVDDPMIRQKIDNRELLRTSNGVELDSETLAAHIGLAKSTKDFDLHRLITFHSRVNSARAFSSEHEMVLNWLPENERATGTLIADYVSGEMNTSDRNRKLNRLRNIAGDERAILSNARCLSEGVDVPALDGIAFIDPRKSQVDIVQAVGRAIRKSDEKTHGTIVIPVFIAEHENAEAALDASSFKPIWDIVNALRSHDDVLAQELDQLRTTLGKRGSQGIDMSGLGKIIIDLPASVDVNFVSALKTRLVEQSTSPWFFWHGLLVEYAQREGHARPVATFKSKDGYGLGVWVSVQRANKDSLSADRKTRLEQLPDWSWDALVDKWNEGHEQLKIYAQREGHARPATRFKTNDGFGLGRWVRGQRKNKDALSADRKKRLEQLPGWSWDLFADQWKERYEQLRVYAQREGHAKPSQSFTTNDGYGLGVWVSVQRANKDALSTDQAKRLEQLPGWSWDPLVDQWNEGYEQLRVYAQREGHARPARRFKTKNGYGLGQWVCNQRRNKDALSADQKKRLEQLPDWSWDPIADQWNEGYEQLRVYAQREGHARPSSSFKTKDGYGLGQWVKGQRKYKDALSTDQAKRLEQLPGWSWDPLADQWNEGYEQLRVYAQHEGHAKPSQSFTTNDGYGLGVWVSVQRRNKDALSADRKKRLEELPGWSWGARKGT